MNKTTVVRKSFALAPLVMALALSHGALAAETAKRDAKAIQAQMQELGKEMAKLTYHMPSTHQLTSQERGSDGSTSTAKINLSSDNKTVTVQVHHKDAKNEYNETIVYEKQ